MRALTIFWFLTTASLVFISPALAGPKILYVTDLEGRKGNIQAMIDQGQLKMSNGKLEIVDPKANLVFGGDINDRGPDSIKLRRWLVDLKERFPNRVTLLWGNRDLNKLSLAQALLDLDKKMHEPMKKWLKEKLEKEGVAVPKEAKAEANLLKKYNTKANQILWWTQNNGIPNALDLHKQEMEELLRKPVSLDQAALDMAKSLDPKTGDYFRYLELGQLGHLEGESLFVHGGVSQENYRVIPGSPERAKTPQAWIPGLNQWGKQQLARFREDLAAGKPKNSSKLLMYGDAVWDPTVNRVMAMDQSVVYPYRVKQDGNFRLPHEDVVNWLKGSGVSTVVVGHSPVGNVPVPLRDNGFLYLHADTSYTGNGVQTTVELKDGEAHVRGVTADGTKLDYKVSAKSVNGAGFKSGENVIVGFTPEGNAVLYRYYDGYKIEEKVVPAAQINRSTLTAPRADVNDEVVAQQKVVREAVQAKGKPVVQAMEELDTLYPNKTPVLFSGASKLSFEDGSEKQIRQVVVSALAALDPKKHLLVTGGTDYGVEKIAHEEARKRGLSTVGFSSVQSAPEGFNLVDRVYFAGNDWDSPLQRALDYIKAKNGQAVFMGGGGVVKRGIEYANSHGVPMALMSNLPGASADAAKEAPSSAFTSGPQLKAKLAKPVAQLPAVISKEELVKRAEAQKPAKVQFVKDAPVLGYRIKSDRFADIPEEIRKHLGEIDKTKYTAEYLGKNVGSVFALQMNGDKPDFYVIGKEIFDTKYAAVPITDVAAKNGKYFGKISEQIPAIVEAKGSNLVAMLKTVPTEMIRASALGYDLSKGLTIESPWGEQTKPAGQDAFLVWDDTKKQYYMVNVGADGNPLSYIPAKASSVAGINPSVTADAKPLPAKDATTDEIRSFFQKKGKKVATFIGYSGAEYEDRQKMLLQAFRELKKLDPKTTLVNIGATPEGIGGVYDLAKRMGFETTGIVSAQAKKYGGLSPRVDHAFYVEDASWGGFLPGTQDLSPTSRAMIENSDLIIGIGGGEVGRDEIVAARKMGKPVTFYRAEMNHRLAIEKAAKKGLAPPRDFDGAAYAQLTQQSEKSRAPAAAQPHPNAQEIESSQEVTAASKLLATSGRIAVVKIVTNHQEVRKKQLALKPQEQAFVKIAPLFGYKIKSDQFNDIPIEIRKHLDPTYTKAYLKENIGSVIALQMNGDKPDFYIIGKATYTSKYARVASKQVTENSQPYLKSLNQHVGSILDAKKSEIVPILKTSPVQMIKMSDLNFPVNAEVTIQAPWGDQIKPAGVDSFLTWDAGKNGYYMVPMSPDGNPLNYLPEKTVSEKLVRLPKHNCPSDFSKLINARIQ